MLLLRCTQRLADACRQLPEAAGGDMSTTRLGDWFANRLNIAQQRYVIALSAPTLLPVIVPARDPAGLPDRITATLGTLLRLIGIAEDDIAAELAEMRPARIAATNDRAVVAALNAAARRAYEELYDLPHRPGRTLDHINLLLAGVPLAPLDYRSPADMARAHLS